MDTPPYPPPQIIQSNPTQDLINQVIDQMEERLLNKNQTDLNKSYITSYIADLRKVTTIKGLIETSYKYSNNEGYMADDEREE